ncbi:MAG: hypothetical protein ACYC9Y_10115 [Candidatus Methylomirabilia bacterium]
MKRAVAVTPALLGALGAAIQAALLYGSGKAICLNEGCRVIEGLTRVPPLYINLAGCGFFLAAAALGWQASESRPARRLLGLLLLAGIAAEGVLFSYQYFVAKAFCSWCLAVLTLVVLLNLLAGVRQALGAAVVFAASLAVFSVLSFGVVQPPSGGRALDGGTYGVRRCAAPAKQVYLVFSSTCPHCAEVLRTLESCNSCNFHFNPIDQIPGLDLPGVERAAAYDPGVNRGLLALLGIEEVPVLLVPGPEGMSIIRGEKRILAYIRAECFRAAPVLNVDPSRLLGDGSLELFRDEKDDGCNVTVDCPPGEEPKK